VLWTKETAAIFEDADGRRYLCTNKPGLASWEDARRRGVLLRGSGEGWVLELDPKSTVLVTGNGGDRIDFATPKPAKTGAKTTYVGRDGSTTVRITSEPKACVDAETGEKLGLSLRVDVGAETLQGCGRDLTSGLP
jgi:hypothetical protein